MRAVLIDNGDAQIVEHKGDLASLQDTVGGYVQTVTLPTVGDGVTVWMNEEGKLRGLPVNHQATLLLLRLQAIAADDVIAGPVLITGVTPAGDTTDLTVGQAGGLYRAVAVSA